MSLVSSGAGPSPLGEPGARLIRLIVVSGFVGYFMPGSVGAEVIRTYGLARMVADRLTDAAGPRLDAPMYSSIAPSEIYLVIAW